MDEKELPEAITLCLEIIFENIYIPWKYLEENI